MAVVQIPNLPAVIALNGTEQLEAVQAGSSVRLSVKQIAQYALTVNIPSSAVTQYQFWSALAATGGIDANLLYQAIPADMEDAAAIQFYTSPFVTAGSPMYNLCVSTYPLLDMNALFVSAALLNPWG